MKDVVVSFSPNDFFCLSAVIESICDEKSLFDFSSSDDGFMYESFCSIRDSLKNAFVGGSDEF